MGRIIGLAVHAASTNTTKGLPDGLEGIVTYIAIPHVFLGREAWVIAGSIAMQEESYRFTSPPNRGIIRI